MLSRGNEVANTTNFVAVWKDRQRRLSSRFFADAYRHDDLSAFYQWCVGAEQRLDN
jgi:hypothetical protein